MNQPAVIEAGSPTRIGQFLDEIAEIGRDHSDGWSRMALSPEERTAHAVFARWAHDLGLVVRTDAVGNTIAEGPGDGPALTTGSHLDTVYRGGQFDGVGGVAAALEATRLLMGAGNLVAPVRVVAFAAEEGARFGVPCIGSRTVVGDIGPEDLGGMRDRDGCTAVEAAEAAGLSPADARSCVWSPTEVAVFLEVHIEQGRVLEERGLHIGVVDAVAGSTRIELHYVGSADHSGATPMDLRRDSLAGAAELVVAVEELAVRQRTAVATVGRLVVEPNSLTTIPGEVTLSVDVRDIDSDRQRDLAERILDRAHRIATRRGLEVSADLLSDQSPVVLHRRVQDILVEATLGQGVGFCMLPSGASHDAQHLSRLVPSGMLFIPCEGGRSHVPDELCDVGDLAEAATIVATALHHYAQQTDLSSSGTDAAPPPARALTARPRPQER